MWTFLFLPDSCLSICLMMIMRVCNRTTDSIRHCSLGCLVCRQLFPLILPISLLIFLFLFLLNYLVFGKLQMVLMILIMRMLMSELFWLYSLLLVVLRWLEFVRLEVVAIPFCLSFVPPSSRAVSGLGCCGDLGQGRQQIYIKRQ